MSKRTITVKKGGLLTTVQDLGRFGSQQYGVVVGGAMDSYSSRIANILVGNDEREAVLEMTFIGAELEFQFDAMIALCGANLSPYLDNKPLSLWKSYAVRKGERLHFKGLISGARTYLAVSGGFLVEEVLGSKSTYLKGQLGGYQGRALKKGDILHCKMSKQRINANLSLSPSCIPTYNQKQQIRVIMGPDTDYFSAKGLETFLSATYVITSAADRMGYRLSGEKISHVRSANILSDAVTFGTIQVPAEGEPIIMMSDRQTTGGYPRIAHVITVDLPLLAQMSPGHEICFKRVELDEAQKLLIERERLIKGLKRVRDSLLF